MKSLNQSSFQLKSEQMQPLLNYMFDLLNNNENLNVHETKDTLEYIEKCIRSFRDDGETETSFDRFFRILFHRNHSAMY